MVKEPLPFSIVTSTGPSRINKRLVRDAIVSGRGGDGPEAGYWSFLSRCLPVGGPVAEEADRGRFPRAPERRTQGPVRSVATARGNRSAPCPIGLTALVLRGGYFLLFPGHDPRTI